MACDLTTIQTEACSSGIGRVRDKITLLQLIAQLTCEASEAAGGGTAWGQITGTLSNQTDLQAQLDLRNPLFVRTINADSSHTGNTTETQLGSILIPGGTLGPNGYFRVTVATSQTNNANAKQFRIRLGSLVATEMSSYSVVSSANSIYQTGFYNRNNQASNLFGPVGAFTVYGSGATGMTTAAVNTASDLTLVFSGALTNSADTITLRQVVLEAYYRP